MYLGTGSGSSHLHRVWCLSGTYRYPLQSVRTRSPQHIFTACTACCCCCSTYVHAPKKLTPSSPVKKRGRTLSTFCVVLHIYIYIYCDRCRHLLCPYSPLCSYRRPSLPPLLLLLLLLRYRRYAAYACPVYRRVAVLQL